MKLEQSLLETINREWEARKDDEPLTAAFISYAFADAFKKLGEEVPKIFDPNTFNGLDSNTYPLVTIHPWAIDVLVDFED